MEEWRKKADVVRALCLIATTEAESGHPTSCLSAADIATVLFDKYFHYDLRNPKNPNNDRFILSKGHAAPLLYTLFSLAGALPRRELLTLRKFKSLLEGHPTPRWKYAEVGTGSLGQGLSVGAGMSFAIAQDKALVRKPHVYVLLGDGEIAEGQVWEACNFASHYSLDNLIVIADINGLAQTGKTMFDHHMEEYEKRFSAFGFVTRVVNGHSFAEIDQAFEAASKNRSKKPFIIIAKTIKGKGVSFLEGRQDFHGKAVKKEDLEKALRELGLGRQVLDDDSLLFKLKAPRSKGSSSRLNLDKGSTLTKREYRLGEEHATREVFGDALVDIGRNNSSVYVFDGDVGNSTFTEKFGKEFPDRFVQCFIAEQNMVGAALGMAALNKTVFAATFGAFLTRVYDQIRMANISRGNMKFVGSHSGVSIGEDGPSQMALEDIAMFAALPGSVVLHPCDAVSSYKLTWEQFYEKGISYLRTLRPKTKVIYRQDEEFRIGGSKILIKSNKDQLVLVAAGITVHEALKAYEKLQKEGISIRIVDCYSIKPIDGKTLKQCVKETVRPIIIAVEDHYTHGGLGDMVLSELKSEEVNVVKLGIQKIPFSGDKDSLFEEFGISASSIVARIKELLGKK